MFVFGLFILSTVLGVQRQALGDQQVESEAFRLLLIDETKTFESTVRVGILAKVLQGTGMFEVSVLLAGVETGYDDPLYGRVREENQGPYDMILIVSKGVDDGSLPTVWVVLGTFGGEAIDLKASMEMLGAFSGMIDQIFQGVAKAVDVRTDLYPLFFAALYLKEGWLR
jgi:hypothetical protein